MSKEYGRAMDALAFTEDAKDRLARTLTAAVEREQARERAEAAAPTVSAPRKVRALRGGKRRVWRTVAASTAAVAVVAAIGGGAWASGALLGVQQAADDLFNGAPAPTEITDKVGVPIGASATSNGVTVTADAIIGDRANYVMVFSIAKDDGTPFDVTPSVGNPDVLPYMWEVSHAPTFFGVGAQGGGMYFYDADPADNAIQFVLQLSVDSDASLIGKTARVHFENLQQFTDPDAGELVTVAEGSWDLKFTMNYEDASVDVPATGTTFDCNGMVATLDELTISPIAVTLRYTVDGTIAWTEQESGKLSDENAQAMDRLFGVNLQVNLADGTSIDATDTGGSSREHDGATTVKKGCFLDRMIDPADVVSITVGNVEIPVK